MAQGDVSLKALWGAGWPGRHSHVGTSKVNVLGTTLPWILSYPDLSGQTPSGYVDFHSDLAHQL